MDRDRARCGSQGFTLVEVLAALAIASVIVVATAGLMHHVVLSFDRGTSRVNGGERLVLAADRLASDIGSARFILQSSPAGAVATFLGTPTKIMFIGAGGIDPGRRDEARPAAEEVVSVTIETVRDTTAVIRSRATWAGPQTRFEDALLRDEVVLVAGLFDASFTFARMMPDGKMSWSNSWAPEQALPRLVKLSLRERATGIDLLGGAEFVIHADAPPACARAGAGAECILGTSATQSGSGPSKPQAPGQEPDEEQEGTPP